MGLFGSFCGGGDGGRGSGHGGGGGGGGFLCKFGEVEALRVGVYVVCFAREIYKISFRNFPLMPYALGPIH